MRVKETGGAIAPIARCRSQKKFADKNPIENESNLKKFVKPAMFGLLADSLAMFGLLADSFSFVYGGVRRA